MAYVVNESLSDIFILRDNANAAITGKTSADFPTLDAFQISAPSTTASVTLIEIGDGEYAIAFTPTTAARWRARVTYNAGGVFRDFLETYDVLPAAADPAAIADALAAVQTTVDGVAAMTDVATSTRATPGAYVAAGGTVATNGDITIRRGNAYLNADGLALPWSSSSWPVLTSATITLQAESAYDDRVTFSAAGAVVTATGTTKAVRVELSEAQTTALTAGDWTYVVHAVLASGNDVELASGAMTVLDPLGA